MTAPALEPLVAEARTMVDRHDPGLAGVWQRAAALLARQALEGAVAQTLASRAPGAERASAHAQLICLPTYAPDEAAYDARYLWSVLSRACHHHPYELAPTAVELDDWISAVERLVESLRRSGRKDAT